MKTNEEKINMSHLTFWKHLLGIRNLLFHTAIGRGLLGLGGYILVTREQRGSWQRKTFPRLLKLRLLSGRDVVQCVLRQCPTSAFVETLLILSVNSRIHHSVRIPSILGKDSNSSRIASLARKLKVKCHRRYVETTILK